MNPDDIIRTSKRNVNLCIIGGVAATATGCIAAATGRPFLAVANLCLLIMIWLVGETNIRLRKRAERMRDHNPL